MNQQDVKDISQMVLDRNQTQDQFGVSQTPFHTHNGADSPSIPYENIVNRFDFVNAIIPGTSAATATNYGVFFTLPYRCVFTGATEVHRTAGTDSSAVTLQVEHLTGTTASGSGTSLLATPFNLKGAANTIQTGILKNMASNLFTLNKGDRLGLVLTGTPTSVAQVVVVIGVQY